VEGGPGSASMLLGQGKDIAQSLCQPPAPEMATSEEGSANSNASFEFETYLNMEAFEP